MAVRVTAVPCANGALQVPAPLMQTIPGGLELTEPLPVPVMVTVILLACMNVAVTDCVWFIKTMQAPVPVQAPLQPVKTEPVAGVAVRVARVPLVSGVLVQVPGHVMPPTSEVTVPGSRCQSCSRSAHSLAGDRTSP